MGNEESRPVSTTVRAPTRSVPIEYKPSDEGQPSCDYEPRPPKLKPVTNFLTEEMVNLYVGLLGKQYIVHKALLCDRSDFFRAMFNSGFRESQEQEASLAEEDIGAMELFVTWLYGTTLKGPKDSSECSDYVALLVLSETFLIEQLHNECVDLIRAYFRHNPNAVRAQDVRYLYANSNNQRLLQLMVRLAAIKALQDFGPGQASLSEGCQELMRNGGLCAVTFAEFLTAGLKYIAVCQDSEERNCAYHNHSRTENCQTPDMVYNKFSGPLFVQREHEQALIKLDISGC